MYKICAVTLLVIIYSQVFSFAQKPVASYHKEVSKAKSDSQKLDLYKQAFEEYKNTHNDSLKILLTRGLDVFDKSNYLKGRASILLMLSGIYSEEMQPGKVRQRKP
ncbi:MAG: hypothetical protein H3C54_06550 [Taibaiella sp.]|nr:hypothetical protein [Taibaiella sp.]